MTDGLINVLSAVSETTPVLLFYCFIVLSEFTACRKHVELTRADAGYVKIFPTMLSGFTKSSGRRPGRRRLPGWGVADSWRGCSVSVSTRYRPGEGGDWKQRQKHHKAWCPLPRGSFRRTCECRPVSHRRLYGGICCLTPSRPATPTGDDSGYSHSAGDERPAATGHRWPEQCEYVR